MTDALAFEPSGIRLDGVSVVLQRNRVLNDVTIDVPPGEILALLGPSGCGKTTMLKVIAGLQDAADGEVFISERAMSGVPPYRRGVGMVFQNYALFPHMTVAGNIEFGLKMQRLDEPARKARATAAMDMLRLSAFSATYPARLSGGQQQRVALARAIAAKPAVMLLDEPLSALDKKLKDSMRAELRDLLKKVGITAIIVTHDQEEALSIADRVAVMNQGEIVQIGAGREIYAAPRTRFVADFVGHMNYLAGTVTEARQGMVVVGVAGGNQVRIRTERPHSPGEQVEVAVRPELIRVAAGDQTAETPDGQNAICATFAGESFLGIVSYLQFELGDGASLLVITTGDGEEVCRPADRARRFTLRWPIAATSIIQ